MRFRQFYSKLYFHVDVDLNQLGGSVPPNFLNIVLEDLQKCCKYSVKHDIIENMNSKQRYTWIMEITSNLVPKFEDQTGTSAISYCVTETMRRLLDCDPVRIADHDCVKVTAVIIP